MYVTKNLCLPILYVLVEKEALHAYIFILKIEKKVIKESSGSSVFRGSDSYILKV